MNGKPLSEPCESLEAVVSLLKRKLEQTSCKLTAPLSVRTGPRIAIADTSKWFLPGIDRASAKGMLEGSPDGTFVVTTNDNHFTLFLSYNYDVSSHSLAQGQNGWVVRQAVVPANTLEECIACLHEDSFGLPCVLTGPPGLEAMA